MDLLFIHAPTIQMKSRWENRMLFMYQIYHLLIILMFCLSTPITHMGTEVGNAEIY